MSQCECHAALPYMTGRLHADKAHGSIDYLDPDNESTFERFSTRIVRCRLARNARVTELNCNGPRSNANGVSGVRNSCRGHGQGGRH